jgi:hypothetical protein
MLPRHARIDKYSKNTKIVVDIAIFLSSILLTHIFVGFAPELLVSCAVMFFFGVLG